VLNGHDSTGFQHELDDASVWYLADGEAPTLVNARTFAAVSPEKKHCRQCQKAVNVAVRCMPAWTLDELLGACKAMYPHLSAALLTALFDRWGGVARYRLQWASGRVRQQGLWNSVREADLAMLLHPVNMLWPPWIPRLKSALSSSG
jgi:hypothetical protein